MRKLDNDVEVTLGGETHLLRPSLKATTAISRQYGGINGALQGALAANIDVFQFVVKTAIVTADRISTEDLKELVWSAGMNALSRPIGDYLGILQNGGRDPDKEEADKRRRESEGGDDEGNSQGG